MRSPFLHVPPTPCLVSYLLSQHAAILAYIFDIGHDPWDWATLPMIFTPRDARPYYCLSDTTLCLASRMAPLIDTTNFTDVY